MPSKREESVRALIEKHNLTELTTIVAVNGYYGAVGSCFTTFFSPNHFGTSSTLNQMRKHIDQIIEQDQGLFIAVNTGRKKKQYTFDDFNQYGRLAQVIQPNIAIDTGPIFTFEAESIADHYSAHTIMVAEVEPTSYDESTKKSRFKLVDIDVDVEPQEVALFRREADMAARKLERYVLGREISGIESPIELVNLVFDVCLLTELIPGEGNFKRAQQFFRTHKLSNRIKMLNEILLAFNEGRIESYSGLKTD